MNFFNKKQLPFLLLFIAVFITRLPFLHAGYGVEEDSWGIALAAFHTKLTGIYEPSRFPGHPVQELIYSALWGYGPMVFNGLSAFFSAIAALFFALILKHLNFKFYFLAALAFVFIPVFYISSTYTIDFVWSEALVLISLYYVLKNKLLLAGIFLGLAVGCRITNGVMLLPFMIILWQEKNIKQNILNLLKISIPMCVLILLVFLPIILQFGTSFFMYYDQFPYPPLAKVFYKMTLGVFGFVGLLAIALTLIVIVLKRKEQHPGELFESMLNKKIIATAFLVIGLYIISYFCLPQKSGYMIPAIPFVILLFGYYANARNFQLLCYSLIISSFFCSINLTDKLRGATYSGMAKTFTISGQEVFFDVLTGPVISDYSKRIQKINYTTEVINAVSQITTKKVIIAGWWYNEIMVTMIPLKKNENVLYEAYIDEDKMKAYTASGYEILYLPEQDIYNDQMFKMKVTDPLAAPF
ncbi:MAG: hypothetical protein JWP12_1771 [Bacteroidetes bacterium]|nr:hypothetical protein [Bacteroidota bacterium]